MTKLALTGYFAPFGIAHFGSLVLEALRYLAESILKRVLGCVNLKLTITSMKLCSTASVLLMSLSLLFRHSAKDLNAQELATSPLLVTRLYLPYAIVLKLHVR